MAAIAGRRVLVVGASKGIGRAIALRLANEGATVVAAARSKDRLDDLVAASGGSAVSLSVDVRDPEQCASVVDEAVAAVGGLDALVYTPATTHFRELKETTADDWRLVMETNVIGAALITAAAAPHLEAASGRAIYLTTEAAAYFPPWRGIGLYLSSKAALEKCVEVWNLEHPAVAFTKLVVGATAGTEFAPEADLEAKMRFAREWYERGYLPQPGLQPEDHAKAVFDILTSEAQIDTMWVRPRG